MSMGYCGYADIQALDDTLVIYSYCCYNLNIDGYERFRGLDDGELYIERDAFVEPEIHEKIRKTASGKKVLITKRIRRDVHFEGLFNTGKIKVKNASGTWQTTRSGIDTMALHILYSIFDEYQEIGKLPEHISWFC